VETICSRSDGTEGLTHEQAGKLLKSIENLSTDPSKVDKYVQAVLKHTTKYTLAEESSYEYET